MEPISAIALVMCVAGVLGGLMNYFISAKEDSANMPWWQHIILGVGASFMVPLFLNMISSSLIKDIIGTAPASPGDPSKLFVLGGFSLVAAVSARAFIRSLTDKVLQDVKEAKSNAQQAKADAQEAKSQASTALDVLDENDVPDKSTSSEEIEIDKVSKITENEQKIMLALTTGKYSMRSMSGLSRDTGLEKDAVNLTISSLMEKDLIEQGKNSKGQLRWYPSPSGRSAIKRANNWVNLTAGSSDL